MVINKQQGSTPLTVSLANFSTTGTAQAWQINSASQTSIARLADVTVVNNAIATTVPSQSITLLVIPAGSIASPPGPPTGLAAAVGSGAVTLNWNAGGGATSYAVKRGTVSGGPYATVGTVTIPSPTSYADSGLMNGTTYYYVVSAKNQAGTSQSSAELPATPIIPPTFNSSATASPNPVTQGNSTTVSVTVTDTANTLSNGVVQVLAVDPGGNTVASQNFTGQSFTTNQFHAYSLAFTPATSGTFVVEVGVFSATWQQMVPEQLGRQYRCELFAHIRVIRHGHTVQRGAGNIHDDCLHGDRHRDSESEQWQCRNAGFQRFRYRDGNQRVERAEFQRRPVRKVQLHLERARLAGDRNLYGHDRRV
jgi:hypothetical protein